MQEQWFVAHPPSRFWHPVGTEYAKQAKALGLKPIPRAAFQECINVLDWLTRYGAKVLVMPIDRRLPASKLRALSDDGYLADVIIYIPGLGLVRSNMMASHRLNEPAHAFKFFAKKLGLPINTTYPVFLFKCEGSSCVIVSPGGTFVIVGYGVRIDKEACKEIEKLFGLPVVALMIQEPAIHTDCLAASLSAGEKAVLFNGSALAPPCEGWNPDEGRAELAWRCEKEGSKIIQLLPIDGLKYGTNIRQLLTDGNGKHTNARTDRFVRVLAPSGLSETYIQQLRECGYEYHPIPMPQLFEQGGGAPACLTNEITAAVKDGWKLPNGAKKYLYENMRPALLRLGESYPDHVI